MWFGRCARVRIEIARGYDQVAFREDLKKLLIGAGEAFACKILGIFCHILSYFGLWSLCEPRCSMIS